MSDFSGSGISNLFGSGFGSSNSSGSNFFNKSRRGISSSNSCNKFMQQSKTPKISERSSLLNSRIDKIKIGLEPIGTSVGHAISYYSRYFRTRMPTYLGGGTFTYHLSCLLTFKSLNNLFGEGPSIILEFGAYYGEEPGYKNYIHYVYDSDKEGGLRFSKMNVSDYRSKVINGKAGATVIDDLIIDNKMTLGELLGECKNDSSWKAKDYNLASHNCQDFIAKVIEILKVKRADNNETKFSHLAGRLNYPPVIVNALEKNDTPAALRITQKIPVVGFFSEFAGFLYKKFK